MLNYYGKIRMDVLTSIKEIAKKENTDVESKLFCKIEMENVHFKY